MSKRSPTTRPELPPAAERMIRRVQERQAQMARAKDQRNSFWNAISILGVVGWSVALPTLIGIALGVWIDRRWPSRFSWALMLLIAGLLFGCFTAWQRIRKDA